MKRRRRRGRLWAVKTRRTKRNSWMPDEVCVLLERRALLGWSIVPGHIGLGEWAHTLRKLAPALEREWKEEHGKAWRLEIRPV